MTDYRLLQIIGNVEIHGKRTDHGWVVRLEGVKSVQVEHSDMRRAVDSVKAIYASSIESK